MIWFALGGLVFVLVIVLVIGASRRKIEVVSLVPPSTTGFPASVETVDLEPIAALARSGRVIDAIAAYRTRTGVGLKEAKEAVEALRDGRVAVVAPPREVVEVTEAAVMAEIRAGRLIDAIKLHRQATGLGLKEAKENVEALRDGRPPPHRY